MVGMMRYEAKEERESAGIKDGSDASFKAASEASDNGGGLDEAGKVARVRGGREGGDDGGDGAEFDVGELLGAVADDLILQFSKCFELDLCLLRP